MSTSAELAEAARVVAVRLREDVYSTDPAAQMLVHADALEAMATRLDGPLTASDEAIETAVQAACAAIPRIEDDDPDNYLTWDETPEDERDKMRQMARVIIEAALPLLKYEAK